MSKINFSDPKMQLTESRKSICKFLATKVDCGGIKQLLNQAIANPITVGNPDGSFPFRFSVAMSPDSNKQCFTYGCTKTCDKKFRELWSEKGVKLVSKSSLIGLHQWSVVPFAERKWVVLDGKYENYTIDFTGKELLPDFVYGATLCFSNSIIGSATFGLELNLKSNSLPDRFTEFGYAFNVNNLWNYGYFQEYSINFWRSGDFYSCSTHIGEMCEIADRELVLEIEEHALDETEKEWEDYELER